MPNCHSQGKVENVSAFFIQISTNNPYLLELTWSEH
jgi:hypothetical protein